MSMAEIPVVICGAEAADCRCGREVAHDGAHECGRSNCCGQWKGTYGGPDFEVVRFPMTTVDAQPIGELS